MSHALQQTLVALERFEGSVPWMYCDTAGRVTVGVGQMLPNAAAAEALPFFVADRPATAAEISSEFTRVEGLPIGRPALFYRAPGKPELGQAQIEAMLQTVVVEFEAALRGRLPGYDSLPGNVCTALLDMAYNLGVSGLMKNYPKLIEAVRAGDWNAAAGACSRRSVGAARNQWTRAMLLGNVVNGIEAVAESGWKRLGFGLVGLCAAGVGRLRRR